MESNDKVRKMDSTPVQIENRTDRVPVDSASSAESVAERAPKSRATGEEPQDTDAAAATVSSTTSGTEASPRGKRGGGPVGDTPFDRHSVKPTRIDWAGLGLAFFGGVGANLFLGFFIMFLQRLFGTALYGPGIVAVLTGLFVVIQLLAPLSAEARRMSVALWSGLLCGYVAIWFLMRPFMPLLQG